MAGTMRPGGALYDETNGRDDHRLNDTPNYKRGSVKRFTHADVGQASIGDRRTSGDCVPVGPGELSDDFETCERIRTMQRNA
jgi:hypothetical protein